MSEMVKSNVKGSYLMFRGKPLVRQGHMMCYGSMQDRYVMMLMMLKNKEVVLGNKKSQIPEKVIVQIMEKDPANPENRMLVKQFDKNGLYDGFMIGLNYLNNLQNKK